MERSNKWVISVWNPILIFQCSLHITLCQYLTCYNLVWVGIDNFLISGFLIFLLDSFHLLWTTQRLKACLITALSIQLLYFLHHILQQQKLLFHWKHRTGLNNELFFDIQNVLPKQNFLSINQIGSRFVIEVSREQTKLKNRFQPFMLCKFHLQKSSHGK